MSTDARAIHRLSMAATIGLVLMVAATAGYIGWPRVANAIGLKPPPPPPAYSAGQQVDVPGTWYKDSSTTLIIFARASCAACEKAQPFLKNLVTRVRGKAVAVMAHPAGAAEEDVAFANSLGIAGEQIKLVPAGLRVRATPTLVLVNRNGTVLDAWEGAGPPERQSSIIKTIDAALR